MLLNIYIFKLVKEDLLKVVGNLQTRTRLKYMLKKVLMLGVSIIQNVKLENNAMLVKIGVS